MKKSKLRRPLVIFSDMDGCISPKRKIWYEEPQMYVPHTHSCQIGAASLYPFDRQLEVMKPMCDHDSGAIAAIKKLNQVELVFISGDERVNRAYAERQDIPFIFTGAVKHSDKWEYLNEYWKRLYKGKPNGQYIYVGDSIPDFHCLMNAGIGFVPSDASEMLKFAISERGRSINSHIHTLASRGGDGVLDEVLTTLVKVGILQKKSVLTRLGIQ